MKRLPIYLSMSLCLSLSACGRTQMPADEPAVGNDAGGLDGGAIIDADRDGYSVGQGDCDDNDDAVHPGAFDKIGDGVDNNCDGIDGIDADADGYASEDSGGGDCDDANGDIHPTANDEVGDGIDNNCDGIDGIDADGDGYASAASGGSDCDDEDGAIHPGATETWYDGTDQDCAGDNDFDTDGDGYESDAHGGSDCNDDNAAVNPGAEEVCGNGVDDDCSGSAAGCALRSASLLHASAVYRGALSTSAAGYSVSGAGDVNGDGYDDLLIGAPGNDNGGTRAGAAHLVLGSASPTTDSLADVGASYIDDIPGDQAGYAVAGVGDVDDDGYDDILVGAPRYDDVADNEPGAAYLVLGSASPGSTNLVEAGIAYTGVTGADWAGRAVSGAGDINGDGHEDLLVGAPGNDDAGTASGATYLVLGSTSPASTSLSEADAEYAGEGSSNYAGWSVSGAADVDGDGFDDVLVGAPGNTDAGDWAGAAYLQLGETGPASASLADADAVCTGEASGHEAGYAVSGAGDVNGDGYDDLLIGAIGNDDSGTWAGAAYLVLGSASPASRSLADADAEYTGEASGDRAGYSVSGPGDVDGDGYDDMLVGAPYGYDADMRVGLTYLVLGGTAPSSTILSTVEPRYTGAAENGFAGWSVSGADDVDGNGMTDLLIGAPYLGETYLLLTSGP
ncbi:MAG: hypothetical protein GXP62_02920 [Oligoflexia bacterium]|nr:hypothetical protein [Oligoflexia bacterium]